MDSGNADQVPRRAPRRRRGRPTHAAFRGVPLLGAARVDSASIGFVALAVLTGAFAGCGAVVFRLLIGLFHNFAFFGVLDWQYDANVHTSASHWGAWHLPWGPWIIVVPIVGAAVVAFLVKTFAPEAKGHGVPEVMDAMYFQGGRIRPVVAVIKALASALSIGTGGAVGREGPIIQIGSAFGSTVGQVLPLPTWQRMTLIACGTAGGIAATFNTPIGGLLFAVELMMPEISARTLVPVALSSGAATVISRVVLGNHPAFTIPLLSFGSEVVPPPMAWVAYVVFGVLLGLWSVVFIRSIYAAEDLFDRMPGGYYVRHMTGMAAVGVLMYLLMRFSGHYYIQGVGYATVQDVLSGRLVAPLFLVLILVLKLTATSLTLGSGGSGGIYSPSLFMGAVLGGAFAWAADRLLPGLALDPVGLGVIGMAGIVGGSTGAVVAAIVMVFEMTGDYQVIIPLMIAVSMAYGVRRTLMEGSIYDMKLRRRGKVVSTVLQTNLYLTQRVRERLALPVLRISTRPNQRHLIRLLRLVRRAPHIVVSEQGKVKAVIPSAVARGLNHPDALSEAIARYEHVPYITVAADDLLLDVIGRLRDSNCEMALVTDDGKLESSDRIRGVLTLSDVILGAQLPRQLLRLNAPPDGRRQPAERRPKDTDDHSDESPAPAAPGRTQPRSG